MSGGEQQRVAVARAIVTTPSVILADEPTGNLDSASGAEVLSLLREAQAASGCTVVVVTHDPQIATIGDEVVHLRDGRVTGRIEVQPGQAGQARAELALSLLATPVDGAAPTPPPRRRRRVRA